MLVLQVALALAGRAPTQEPPQPEPPSLAAMVRELRDDRLTSETRGRLVDAFIERGEDGRRALFDASRRILADRQRAFDQALDRHLREVGKAARKLVRTGRAEQREIDELRARSRAISGSGELSKSQIHDDLDPLLERLRELTLPEPDQVMAADEALRGRHEALRRTGELVREWHEVHCTAMRALDATEAGRRHVDRVGQVMEPRSLTLALDGPVADATLLAVAPERDGRVLRANAELSAAIAPQEFDGILQLNKIRIALGRAALAIDTRLCDAARGHSEDMRDHSFFSHTSPIPGKESFGQRAALAGTSASAENIAAGQDTGAGAIRAWWYSPGHHRNMLGGHGRVGLGRADGLWTQLFGG